MRLIHIRGRRAPGYLHSGHPLELAEMGFHLGCAVWGHRGWVGELFPAGSRQTDFLSLFSRRFPCVEGNTTFYATPRPQILARWVE